MERTFLLKMILAGGLLVFGVSANGQDFDCLLWEQKRPINSPSPRYGHAMAYDGERGVTVLFGGAYCIGGDTIALGDTWEWNGLIWSLRSTSGPPARYDTAIAYDESRGVTVLFGGINRPSSYEFFVDTWEWDGAHWTEVSSRGPLVRYAHAMAYDHERGVTVQFGGRSPFCGVLGCGDTWEWDGVEWKLRSTIGASPRWNHAIAYDRRRQLTILYGGTFGSSETWEWDGRVWLSMSSQTNPARRQGHTMVYDSARANTLLFSGYSSYGVDAQTWGWDGTTWTLFSEIGPPGRLYSAMAYDSARAVTVLFGGYGTAQLGDTWELLSCPVDSDGDGILDVYDVCDHSDLSPTIVIDGCDTEVANHLFEDGCTFADRIAACAEEAGNHGAFVQCVAHLAAEWAGEDIVAPKERGPIQRCAAQSNFHGELSQQRGLRFGGHELTGPASRQ